MIWSLWYRVGKGAELTSQLGSFWENSIRKLPSGSIRPKLSIGDINAPEQNNVQILRKKYQMTNNIHMQHDSTQFLERGKILEWKLILYRWLGAFLASTSLEGSLVMMLVGAAVMYKVPNIKCYFLNKLIFNLQLQQLQNWSGAFSTVHYDFLILRILHM